MRCAYRKKSQSFSYIPWLIALYLEKKNTTANIEEPNDSASREKNEKRKIVLNKIDFVTHCKTKS